MDLDNLYKSLKTKSLGFENQANDSIQRFISDKKLIQFSSLITPLITQSISKIKENQELFSSILDIPTKNDLASTAKLVIETQEKIDALEEQNWQLIDLNEKLLKMNSGNRINERMERMEEEQNLIKETLMQMSKDRERKEWGKR